MKRCALFLPLVFMLLFATGATAQTAEKSGVAPLPEDAEVLQLVSQADQKVTSFESSLKSAKPLLDKISPDTFKEDAGAASDAHVLVHQIQKNGPTAVRLFGLLATMDDLTLDARTLQYAFMASYAKSLIQSGTPDTTLLVEDEVFLNSSTSLSDISTLLFHTTFRYVNSEETALEKFMSIADKSGKSN